MMNSRRHLVNNYLQEFIKLSAEQDCPAGQYAYGYLFDTGLGGEEDHTKAIYY